MAADTCYRVTVAPDGTLARVEVDFTPRFADSIAAALERLRTPHLEPPIVRFGDWPELLRRWAEERGEVTP